MKNFDQLLQHVESRPLRTVAVAQDHTVLSAAREALDRNIARLILVGDEDETRSIASDHSVSLDGLSVVNEPDGLKPAPRAVEMVSSGEAEIFMKGQRIANTATLLSVILRLEATKNLSSCSSSVYQGLRRGRASIAREILRSPQNDREGWL